MGLETVAQEIPVCIQALGTKCDSQRDLGWILCCPAARKALQSYPVILGSQSHCTVFPGSCFQTTALEVLSIVANAPEAGKALQCVC